MVFLRPFRRVRSPLPLLHRLLSTAAHNASTQIPGTQTQTEKPFYITTPIFYPNASPHIGHLYTLVTADVFARYQRGKGKDVRFLAGTDEHGMKIQRAARAHFGGEAGREKEFCDSLSERFRDLGRRANISNTCFMRTSSKEHHRAVEHVWRDLYAKGYIYKSLYEGWYSITDECFYTDSQITFSTPTTATSTETGASVEWTSEENYMFRLSALRDALLEHYTARPGSVYPEQYYDNVLGMLGAAPMHPSSSDFGAEAGASADVTVKGGVVKTAMLDDFVLSDISISRPRSRLEWGVQVPDDPEQTVYVWFDALLIYLTGTGYPWASPPPISAHASTSTPSPTIPAGWDNTQGWPADVQVIGKDILRFHAIYLPAILLALSGGPYTGTTASPNFGDTSSLSSSSAIVPLPKTLLTHAHWTSSQKKMSKSLGNVADPVQAMEEWGVDVVRFYMMRVGGRWRADADWSTEQLDKHHKEIQSQLGNYFLRIASPRIAERAKGGAGPIPEALERVFVEGAPSASASASVSGKIVDAGVEVQEDAEGHAKESEELNAELLRHTLALKGKVDACMDQLEAGNALAEIMGVLRVANKILTDIAPWARTTPPDVVHATRVVALETLRVVAGCLGPFMPAVGRAIEEGLGVVGEEEEYNRERGKNQQKEEIYGPEAMRRFWTRWEGKDVRGVKLF